MMRFSLITLLLICISIHCILFSAVHGKKVSSAGKKGLFYRFVTSYRFKIDDILKFYIFTTILQVSPSLVMVEADSANP